MRSIRIAVVLTVLLLALPVMAEEILYFTSGQSMAVRSHEVLDGMVHVDLGDNARMAFPLTSIDRVEVAGAHVALKPSYGTGSKRRVPTTAGSYPSQNYARPQDRKEIPTDHTQASPIETDERTGMAGYRPQGNHHAKNRRQMVVNGNMRVLGNNPTRRGTGSTFGGTTQVGDRHVIGGLGPRRTQGAQNPNAAQPVPLSLNPGVGTTRTETSRPTDGGRATPPPPASDQN